MCMCYRPIENYSPFLNGPAQLFNHGRGSRASFKGLYFFRRGGGGAICPADIDIVPTGINIVPTEIDIAPLNGLLVLIPGSPMVQCRI